MIGISPEKVVFIALQAREYDAKVASWDDSPQSDDAENDPESILEDFSKGRPPPELAEFMDTLNVDEKEALVALTWVGRGTYSPEKYDEALKVARTEHINKTRDYLLGTPLLSDYLLEGLSQMGYPVEQLEEDMIQRRPDWPTTSSSSSSD